MPRLLNYIVAIYLIITGLLGLFGNGGSFHMHESEDLGESLAVRAAKAGTSVPAR